jgi:hypothetical protein
VSKIQAQCACAARIRTAQANTDIDVSKRRAREASRRAATVHKRGHSSARRPDGPPSLYFRGQMCKRPGEPFGLELLALREEWMRAQE